MNTKPDSLRNQWKILKELPWKKKPEHIWNYYRYGIFAALFVLVLIVWGVQAGIEGSKEPLISGMLINTDTTEAGAAFLTDDYWQFCGGDKGQKVELLRGRSIPFGSSGSSEAEYANFLMFSAMVSAKGLDYVIANEATVPSLEEEEILMDFRTILTEEQLAKLDTIETDTGIIAIRLADTAFARRNPFTVADACLMVISNTPSVEKTAQFVNYLLADD